MLAGVPVVCIPFFGDQLDYCRRIADNNAGIYLEKSSFTATELQQAVNSILTNSSYQIAAKNTGKLLHCGGAEAAADIVLVCN